MSFNLSTLKSELDAVVNEATSVVDLVDKYAATAAKFASFVPGVGAEAQVVVKVIDDLDKALHAVKNVVNAL
jgi:ABC-type transporter Mla subunit MlaD